MLMSCQSCGDKISSRALNCPHCKAENLSAIEVSEIANSFGRVGNPIWRLFHSLRSEYSAAAIGAFLGLIFSRLVNAFIGLAAGQTMVIAIFMVGGAYLFFKLKHRYDRELVAMIDKAKRNYIALRAEKNVD